MDGAYLNCDTLDVVRFTRKHDELEMPWHISFPSVLQTIFIQKKFVANVGNNTIFQVIRTTSPLI